MARAKLSKALRNSYVRTAILGIILLVAFWFGSRAALRTDYPFLAVASGSMTPTLNIGDLIVVQGVSDATIEINSAPRPNGTIIIFHRPNDPSELIVHRAISSVENSGTYYFQTRGDNNPSADIWSGPDTLNGMISSKLLVGKVVGVVPWIGNVPLFIRTPPGMVIVIFLFLIVLLIEFVPDILKKTQAES